MQQTELWQSAFGNMYHERNKITQTTLDARKKAWDHIIRAIMLDTNGVAPKSFIEIGAGNGQNLQAIHELYDAENKPKLHAIEPNVIAAVNITALGIAKTVLNMSIEEIDVSRDNRPVAEVAFTSGLLIHIHPDKLEAAMKRIVSLSSKYVVCLEYFAPECRELPYRGMDNALWANDFGSLYIDKFGLVCIGHYFFWKRVTGLDNLTGWIFRKGN